MEVVMEVAMEVITFCAAARSGLPSRPIEKDLSGSRSSASLCHSAEEQLM